MTIAYIPNDPAHWSTALRIDSVKGNLNWDSNNGQDAIIVKTPFGVSAIDMMRESICPAVCDDSLTRNAFTEVLPNVKVRLVTSVDKARQGGCPLDGRACTYTVFSVVHDEHGNWSIIEPSPGGPYSPALNVPYELKVLVRRVTTTTGLFIRREVETDFWEVVFDGEVDDAAEDLGLRYTLAGLADGLEIPITAQAINAGHCFVKSGSVKPQLKSIDPGLRILLQEE